MYKKEIVEAIVISTILFAVILVAVIAFIIQYRSRKLQYANETAVLKEKHHTELLNTELEIQNQTMQHIGQEIHDNIGQKLTLASLYIQQLAFENKGISINEKIESIGNIINQSLSELRQLSKSLTDNVIDNSSIITLLEKEFEKIRELKKYETKLIINVKEVTLPYQTKSVLLRVVQEFTQNSIKHAHCKTIATSLVVNKDQLKFILADDGVGFDMTNSASKGIGLINMKNRIELIGGSYFMQSHKNVGTILTIKITL
jgi:signal transduction histidine kinase